jgi:hypothetical protein
MCQLTIAEYNRMFNANLSDDHHYETLSQLQLVLAKEVIEDDADGDE